MLKTSLVTLLKLICFLANRKVHRGRRLTGLIGGYSFVSSGSVHDNRDSGGSGGCGLRQKHVSQSFLSADCDKLV